MTDKDRSHPDNSHFEMELADELGFGHKALGSDSDWREELTDREISLLTKALIRKLTHQDSSS